MPKTLPELLAEISSNFPDNSAGAITAELLRNTTGDIAASAFLYPNDAYIVVQTSDDPVANGGALQAAYAAAMLLTPNGQGLSSSNHAVVILPPGEYDLETTPLILPEDDGDNVDIVGLTGDPKHVLISSAVTDMNSGTIVQQCVQVIISGVRIKNTASTQNFNDATDACAFCLDNVDGGFSDCRYENCIFDGGGTSWPMRQSVDYWGTFINCTGTDFSWGGHGGSFSGVARNCVGSENCFAHGGEIKSTAVLSNCRCSNGAFAVSGTIRSGALLTLCEGRLGSFGNTVETGAILKFCTAGSLSFGLSTFNGTALGCTSGEGSFGREGGTFGGEAIDCTVADPRSFGGAGGVFSGVVKNLTWLPAGNAQQGWAPSVFTGRFSNVTFAPDGADSNGATIPDGATGAFEFCTFRKTGSGIPLGIAAAGAATIQFSFCKFNTTGAIEAGITNDLGATLALAFNIGNAAV